MPTVVNRPVFSLAGAQSSPRGMLPPVFADPVPLGVRIYSHTTSTDVWVTRWVENLQYRSVIPGGFANASFRLHVPQHMAPVSAPWATAAERTPLIRLFNRVQIVDQRSGEICWEGRIDSAARVTDDGFAWDIGCAGAMISATDITRPVFYADSTLEYWAGPDSRPDLATVLGLSRSDSGPTLKADLKAGTGWGAGADFYAFYHFLCFQTNQYLGRFSITYASNAPNATGGTGMATRANVYTQSTATWQEGVDVTNLGAAAVRKSNNVSTDFTSTQAQVISVDIINNNSSTVVTIPSSSSGGALWSKPIVIAMRMDRNGNNLTAASNYSAGDWVTVSQVVEDVVGRFLNQGWSNGNPNTPASGSVSGSAVSIDTTDTTHISDLKFADGATAADILNRLMTVQTNAYWAIWESTNTATNNPNAARYRFEWARWPASWGYLATSMDGLDEQPDARDVYNFVWYLYSHTWNQDIYTNPVFNQEYWDSTDPANAPLLQNTLTRGATVNKDGVTDDNTAFNNSGAWIAANGTEVNAGSIVIKRPIQFYDPGTSGYSGASRTVDPWMLRPGKLLRITNIPSRAEMTRFNHGTVAPPATHTGAVFKVVATEYNAGDNSCRLELDQVTRWALPGQILPVAKTNTQNILG